MQNSADSLRQIEHACVEFIRSTFQRAKITTGIIAVSGGIDSAVSLSLLCKALGPEHVHAVLLPYEKQDMQDAELICAWNALPSTNVHTISITKEVDSLVQSLAIQTSDTIRKGNVMARVRMIMVYDLAKKLEGMVCGTENKSEHYLGYFTRFGDAASDLEPIAHLYKTEVRALAEYMQLPSVFVSKTPSAGLWNDQTDEQELGFSYADADVVLRQYVDEKKSAQEIVGVDQKVVSPVIERIKQQAFKLEVPYTIR